MLSARCSSPIGIPASLADGTLRGRFLVAVRAFSFRQSLLELAQNVSADLRISRRGLLTLLAAHRRNSSFMAAVIGPNTSNVSNIRKANDL
jgi:hypothetical protein